MKPVPLLGYAVLIAALLFAVFSMGGGTSEQSATMAPDLRSSQ
jgi:hypothetical protein